MNKISLQETCEDLGSSSTDGDRVKLENYLNSGSLITLRMSFAKRSGGPKMVMGREAIVGVLGSLDSTEANRTDTM